MRLHFLAGELSAKGNPRAGLDGRGWLPTRKRPGLDPEFVAGKNGGIIAILALGHPVR